MVITGNGQQTTSDARNADSHRMVDQKVLDRHDILILSALGEDPRMPASELGTMVHLSRTAVSRRLQNLKDSGVLEDSPQLARYESVGLATRAFVELYARDKNVDFVSEALLERAEVLKVSVVASRSLLLLEVVTVDLDRLSHFMKWLQRFGDTETKIVFFSENSKMTLKDRLDRLIQPSNDGTRTRSTAENT